MSRLSSTTVFKIVPAWFRTKVTKVFFACTAKRRVQLRVAASECLKNNERCFTEPQVCGWASVLQKAAVWGGKKTHTRTFSPATTLRQSWRMNAAAVSHPPSERLVLNANPKSRRTFHFKYVQQKLQNVAFVSSFLSFFCIGCKCIHSCVPCKGPFATSTLIDSTDKQFFCVQNSKRDFASRDICCCLNKLVNAETL